MAGAIISKTHKQIITKLLPSPLAVTICFKIVETQTDWWRVEQTALGKKRPRVKCIVDEYNIVSKLHNEKYWKYAQTIITENIFQPTYAITLLKVTSDYVIESWCTASDKLAALTDVWMVDFPKGNYSQRWIQCVGQ